MSLWSHLNVNRRLSWGEYGVAVNPCQTEAAETAGRAPGCGRGRAAIRGESWNELAIGVARRRLWRVHGGQSGLRTR